MIIEYAAARYRCSECRKSWASKQRANAHALNCAKDPALRGCGSCVHDVRGEPASYDEPGVEPHCEIGVREAGDLYLIGCGLWVTALREGT